MIIITIALIKKEEKNQFGVDMNLINVRHFLEQLLYLCYAEIKASISLGETLCLLAFDMMRPIFLHYV